MSEVPEGAASLESDSIRPPRHTRIWLPPLAAIALFKIGGGAVAVVSGAWSGRALGWVLSADVVAFAAAGLYLLAGGRFDRRAVWLSCVFLLIATAFADSLLGPFVSGSQPWGPDLRWLLRVQPAALTPFFFFHFVREFPRRRGTWGSRFPRAWARLCFGVGLALFLANLALLLPVGSGLMAALRLVDRTRQESVFWPSLFLAGLPALPYALLQARRSPPDERRRVGLLLLGLALGVAPDVFMSLAASVSPAFARFASSGHGLAVLGAIGYPALLSIPVVTAYAVLAQRALDVRLIVRKALRYALARSTIVAGVMLPFGLALVLLYTRRDDSIQAVLSGSAGLVLAAVLLAGAAAWHLRDPMLDTLDRHFYREQYDAHRILSGLVGRSASLHDPGEVASLVTAEVDRALHLDAVEMLLLDPRRAVLASAVSAARPLPLTSRLARELGAAVDPLEVDWQRPGGWMSALDPEERGWLLETGARLVVPVAGAEGWPVGALLLGEKRSELPFSREDRLLLREVAASTALALQQHQRVAPSAGEVAPSARECACCGLVADVDAAACSSCGGPVRTAPVPVLIAGKLRPIQRIGSGGMGVVYRALDLSLDREVAVKTLPAMTSAAAGRLRREARAMAAVSHPNLGMIHGVETWNGAPMLVVELLVGGTLADRLASGPLSPAAALDLGCALAPALARLHAAGILHRDVKPSNIGFAADGTPKLLDFGVARVVPTGEEGGPPGGPRYPGSSGGAVVAPETTFRTRTGELVGTLAYLSPEVARGAPPDPHLDLWGLCLVLWEAIAGVHPFGDASPHMLLRRIAAGHVPDVTLCAPEAPEGLAAFLRDALHADIHRRPATAGELCQRLARVRVELSETGDLTLATTEVLR